MRKLKNESVEVNNSKRTCRICYNLEEDSTLIAPCKCSGSMKYIHFRCLQKWLKSKVLIKQTITDYCYTYIIQNIECELCKTTYPDVIKYRNNTYNMREFIKSSYKKYVIIESLTNDKFSNRLLFYINIDSKENLRIGRGNDSDIRISDITVSRFHSIISITKDDTLILQDNNSKFGTLVLLRNPNLNIQEESIYLQIGRSLIEFYVQVPFNLFSCFSEKNKEKSLDYIQLNHEYVDKENIIVIKKYR